MRFYFVLALACIGLVACVSAYNRGLPVMQVNYYGDKNMFPLPTLPNGCPDFGHYNTTGYNNIRMYLRMGEYYIQKHGRVTCKWPKQDLQCLGEHCNAHPSDLLCHFLDVSYLNEKGTEALTKETCTPHQLLVQ